MTPKDFDEHVRRCDNYERACHRVFNEAHSIWMLRGRKHLTDGQLVVLNVETFYGEVCNGGLEQFLDNDSGRLADTAPTSLRTVGLHHAAACLDRAIERLPGGRLPTDHDDMLEAIEAENPDDPFEDLNSQFFAQYDADDFREKLYTYIVEHEDEFTRPRTTALVREIAEQLAGVEQARAAMEAKDAQWARRPRTCPKCSNVFTARQDGCQCTKCGHRFLASEAG